MKIMPKISIRREPAKRPEPGRGTAIQIHTEATHYGMRIYLPETLENDRLLDLLSRIPAKAFVLPDDKSIALDFQSRLCTQEFLVKLLCNVIWRKRIKITAWLSSNKETLKLFKNSGLAAREPELPDAEKSGKIDKVNKIDKIGKNINIEDEGEGENNKNNKSEKIKDGYENYNSEKYNDENENNENDNKIEIKYEPRNLKVLYNSMRSGDSLVTSGDVLLWGHLNAGAEIKADGNVIVAGKLRGLVHAGRALKSANNINSNNNNERVFVMAGSFEASQVRLGRKLCYADENTAGWQKSVLITLEDGLPIIRENKF